MTKKIAVIVGSLRKESFNRKMANFLISLAPSNFDLEIKEIGQLPLYNQDYDDEGNPPAQWIEFRQQIRASDGLLFVTPEYNRSLPGVLKNALDVGSRPYGQSAWEKKPGAVISVSPGAIGGFGANHHLRQTFVFLDILPMQQPEAYMGGAAELFNAEGKVTNEATCKFLQSYMNAFEKWVNENSSI